MAELGPKRPAGIGGEWTAEKKVRKLNQESGRWEPTGATRTVHFASHTEHWSFIDGDGVQRSGRKSIVGEGKDAVAAARSRERRDGGYEATRVPTAAWLKTT